MTTLLIVDDEYPARQLMRMLVERLNDYTVVAEASDGRQALELYRSTRPDIILTDIEMPVMNGLELIEAVKAENPDQPIIILSCYESFRYAQRAMRAGVRSYLIKDMTDRAAMQRCLEETAGTLAPEAEPADVDLDLPSSDTFEKIRHVQPISAEGLEKHLDTLFTAYFKHDADPCVAEIRRLYRFNLNGMLQYRFLQFINSTVVRWISMEMSLLKQPADSVFGTASTPEAQLEDCASPSDMSELLCDWLRKWFQSIRENKLVSDRGQGILSYIADHYHEEFSLDNLARQFFLHPVHLSRSFKSDTNTTLTTSVNILRIEKAKLLMAVGNRKVNEIAYMVGFGSPQGFYSAFKKHTGMSPAQYIAEV